MANKKEAEKLEKTAKKKAEKAAEKAEEKAEAFVEEAVEEKKAPINKTLAEKAERREAKAARKAKNAYVEKQKRPSNLVLFILIFGVLIIMFGFVKGYEYSHLEKSLQSYIKSNGGKEAYANMVVDETTTCSISAKGNELKIKFTVETDDKDTAKAEKEYYKNHAENYMKYTGASYLNYMKPFTRALSPTVKICAEVNGKNVKTVNMKWSEVKKFLKDYEKGDIDVEFKDMPADEDAEADLDTDEAE